MKIHNVQLYFAMILFVCIAAIFEWCSKEIALLIIIIHLLTLIVTLLSRIYNIIKHSANLRSKTNKGQRIWER